MIKRDGVSGLDVVGSRRSLGVGLGWQIGRWAAPEAPSRSCVVRFQVARMRGTLLVDSTTRRLVAGLCALDSLVDEGRHRRPRMGRAQGVRGVGVLDLSWLERFDVGGIRDRGGGRRRAARSRRLALCGGSPRFRKLWRLLGFDALIRAVLS
jgi:hypothetical protein